MEKRKTKPKFDVGVARVICDFAHEHGMVIHPKGYGYYIDSFLMFQHCPCDAIRKKCPCDESIDEVAQNGHCLCRLLWRDYAVFKEKALGG